MRDITVVNFMTLDGVVQGPLSADEDTEGGFTAGGWTDPYMDEVIGRVMSDATTGAGGLVLGRKTYETFARTWSVADPAEPAVAALNKMPKYVVSTTLTTADWENSHIVGMDELPALKQQPGGDLVVFGSSALIPALIEAGLVDRWTLLVFPLVLGTGKKMFATGTTPATLTLRSQEISTTGVLVLRYDRA